MAHQLLEKKTDCFVAQRKGSFSCGFNDLAEAKQLQSLFHVIFLIRGAVYGVWMQERVYLPRIHVSGRHLNARPCFQLRCYIPRQPRLCEVVHAAISLAIPYQRDILRFDLHFQSPETLVQHSINTHALVCVLFCLFGSGSALFTS